MITNLELYGTNNIPKIPESVANQRITLLKARLEMLCHDDKIKNRIYLIMMVKSSMQFWEQLKSGEGL